ncbi:PA2169 family four-helix-bundle protein [Luteolibacter marinus]|uniref:PA2169 family four-helix-bundle protein n=1 Tax=Luteolibacter marinus TaxID=2776705 RepID=UPI001868ADAE|nr:PA2169 family four-helix-bundle protein [Luteolibacter marinus]
MDAEPASTAVPDLQNVLTRYADSYEGFHQAAELMPKSHLADAFREIAARRHEIGQRVSGLIRREGEQPEAGGSVEGGAHRWWMRLREKLGDDELQAVLAECVRGEEVLAGSLETALKSQELTAEQAELLREALAEVKTGIGHFTSALKG